MNALRLAAAIVVCLALIVVGLAADVPVFAVAGAILLALVVVRGIVIGIVRDVRHGR